MMVSCLPALGADSLRALGGWHDTKMLFQRSSCGEKVIKPCTQTGVCGTSTCCLGALSTGVRPPASTALVLLVNGCFFRPQSSVQRHVRPLLFPSQSLLVLKFFQASQQFAVPFGFRHYWGVCLHLLLWSLLSRFCPSSRARMGLELGLYAHILGLAILSQFARFPRHVAFLRLRLGFVAGVLPSCSGC